MKPRTFHRAPRDLVGGTVHRQRGVRPCRREDRVGLFKNEAVATVSLFCIGAVKTELDVVEVVFEWVHWYSCERLRSSLFHQAPEEFERPIMMKFPARYPTLSRIKRQHGLRDGAAIPIGEWAKITLLHTAYNFQKRWFLKQLCPSPTARRAQLKLV